jgi:dUTP pyrophosphatase
MQVKFKKLSENAVLPRYAMHGDAGLDLFPVAILSENGNVVCSFGFAVEIPEGYVGLIFPRSGIYKHSYTLSNSVGVIDSGYRGEVKAVFKKFPNYAPSFYSSGQAVAQMIIVPYPVISPVWADELSETERSSNGFGHTTHKQP